MLKNKIREFRTLHGLTQEGLAARTGVAQRSIISLEADVNYVPSGETMLKLANYFNCELGVLFFIDRDAEPQKVAS